MSRPPAAAGASAVERGISGLGARGGELSPAIRGDRASTTSFALNDSCCSHSPLIRAIVALDTARPCEETPAAARNELTSVSDGRRGLPSESWVGGETVRRCGSGCTAATLLAPQPMIAASNALSSSGTPGSDA